LKFLVIDSGKSKTIAAVYDSNLNVHCSVVGGPSDISLERDVVLNNVSHVVSTCLNEANCRLEDLDLVVFSWAGLDTERDFEIAWSVIDLLGYPRSKVVLVHDALAAYYAVTGGEPGVAVIAGTGAIAYGVNRRGVHARSSGWGWIIGDEGSGLWIALQALNAVARAYDGRGPSTSLLERIKEYYGLRDLLDIVTPIYRTRQLNISKLAGLAEVVNEEAEKGDVVALEILSRAGRELALAAYSVAKKLDMVEDEGVIVGGVGSVFTSRVVRRTFEDEVRRLLPRSKLREPLIGYKALVGPVIIVLRKLRGHIDSSLLEAIERSVEEVYARVKVVTSRSRVGNS
jgi:N-acetylglucosamine kinase-like BadF-type ATPase